MHKEGRSAAKGTDHNCAGETVWFGFNHACADVNCARSLSVDGCRQDDHDQDGDPKVHTNDGTFSDNAAFRSA